MHIDEAAPRCDGQPKVPDPEAAASERVAPSPLRVIGPAEDEEPDPLTFEDSLDLREDAADTDADAQDSTEEDSADAEEDPDAPAQMNLF